MKHFFFGLMVAIMLVTGAFVAFQAAQPEPAEASGGTMCSIYDPTLRKWWCPEGTVCGSHYGDCWGV